MILMRLIAAGDGRKGVFKHDTALSGGVGILCFKSFNPTSFTVAHSVQGRCLLIIAQFDQFSAAFINVYDPNSGAERKIFLETVSNKLQGCGSID